MPSSPPQAPHAVLPPAQPQAPNAAVVPPSPGVHPVRSTPGSGFQPEKPGTHPVRSQLGSGAAGPQTPGSFQMEAPYAPLGPQTPGSYQLETPGPGGHPHPGRPPNGPGTAVPHTPGSFQPSPAAAVNGGYLGQGMMHHGGSAMPTPYRNISSPMPQGYPEPSGMDNMGYIPGPPVGTFNYNRNPIDEKINYQKSFGAQQFPAPNLDPLLRDDQDDGGSDLSLSSLVAPDEVCWCPWCWRQNRDGEPENVVLGSFEKWRIHMHEQHFDRLGGTYAADEAVPCYWCCRPCVTEKGQRHCGNTLPFWGSHERVCRENPNRPALPGQGGARSSAASSMEPPRAPWVSPTAQRGGKSGSRSPDRHQERRRAQEETPLSSSMDQFSPQMEHSKHSGLSPSHSPAGLSSIRASEPRMTAMEEMRRSSDRHGQGPSPGGMRTSPSGRRAL